MYGVFFKLASMSAWMIYCIQLTVNWHREKDFFFGGGGGFCLSYLVGQFTLCYQKRCTIYIITFNRISLSIFFFLLYCNEYFFRLNFSSFRMTDIHVEWSISIEWLLWLSVGHVWVYISRIVVVIICRAHINIRRIASCNNYL